MNKLLIPVAVIVLLFSCKPAVLEDQELLEYAQTLNPDDLKRHVAVLAHDSLEGRLPGTAKYDVAMQYVADELEAMGIKPKGDKGGSTYFQHLTLRRTHVEEATSYLILGKSDTLKAGRDYFYLGNANEEDVSFEGQLVMTGFGIEAPEFGYNDFENLDVRGKIAIVYYGGPDVLPATERAYFSNWDTKVKTLDRKGALGFVFVGLPNGRVNFDRSYERSENGRVNVLLKSGEATGRTAYGENIKLGAFFNWQHLQEILDVNADSLLNLYLENQQLVQPESAILLSGHVKSISNEFESANVVGLLEGGDLKDEYIVHTAHLDHVGIGKPVNGDSIYNGAHDNASGISAMLEIARLYSNLPAKPKRSILFAAVTAEEMGLLGSKYLAKTPVVPEEQIIANVNTDMPIWATPIVSVQPLGAEQSSIMQVVEHATALLGLTIEADHAPESVRFVRSDNLNYVLQGVPALRMKIGMQTSESPTGNLKEYDRIMSEVYHKPSDQLNDDFNWETAKVYTMLQFMNSYIINTSKTPPTWNDNSFFKRFSVKK